MKLRLILIVISLLAFLSASVGGYLYYRSMREAAINEADRQAAARVEAVRKNLSFFLAQYVMPAKAMAGLGELRDALVSADDRGLLEANKVLDYFNHVFEAEVCYLISAEGLTIASSNRNYPDSFVGQNFGFRPYFRDAIKGYPSTYLALGTTSKKRGAYFSHPVFQKEGESPSGVVVVKASIEQIEKDFPTADDEILLVCDPHGVVFISSRKDWLYRLFRETSERELEKIAWSRQFGDGPWLAIGLTFQEENHVEDASGKKYLTHRVPLDYFKGWEVVHLQNLEAVSRRVSDPLLRTTGPVIMSLCFLVGISVVFLYSRASQELERRKSSERELKETKEQLSRYSKDLELQVEKRTEEIASFLKYTPDVVSVKDREGRYVLVNRRFEELFRVKSEEIRGRTDHDIHGKDLAEQFRRHDLRVLSEGRSCQVEEQVPQNEGVHTYLSVKFPIYDGSETPTGVGSISTDITAAKKAQDRLRRLSGSIMTGQEKERAAIARELHDELGQILTALNMDAVWLARRFEEGDPKAADRADGMRELIDRTIDAVRGMALRLRPKVLDDLGLVDALEWLTADFEKRTEINCIFNCEDVPVIHGPIATAAYRIAQEALTNVARHSFANQARVELSAQEGALSLEIEDNGRGFNTLDISEFSGLGIAGMRERAMLAGGILDVRSQPDRGARITFKVPLNRNENLVE